MEGFQEEGKSGHRGRSEVRVGGGKQRGREKGRKRWRERKGKHERKRGVGGREGEMSVRLFYDSQGQTFGEVVLFLPEQVFSRRHFFLFSAEDIDD